MPDTAKLFKSGGSQAVRLPKEYRFDEQDEVLVYRQGNRVILEPRKRTWSREFLDLAGRGGLPLYLETNGLDTAALESVIGLVDIISLDIKLPSLCGGDDIFPMYRETLAAALDRDLFCKIVVAGGTDAAEFEKAAGVVAGAGRDIPLVIQPATPAGAVIPPDPQLLLDLAAIAARMLEDVRIIPQCHLIMGLP